MLIDTGCRVIRIACMPNDHSHRYTMASLMRLLAGSTSQQPQKKVLEREERRGRRFPKLSERIIINATLHFTGRLVGLWFLW